MLFNLNSSFQSIMKKFTDGKLTVTGIHDYGDKLIIVLRLPDAPPDKSVTVVDCTSNPEQDIHIPDHSDSKAPAPKAIKAEPAPKLDKRGRAINSEGEVLCKYCGKPCTSRGATRHENNCRQKPM